MGVFSKIWMFYPMMPALQETCTCSTSSDWTSSGTLGDSGGFCPILDPQRGAAASATSATGHSLHSGWRWGQKGCFVKGTCPWLYMRGFSVDEISGFIHYLLEYVYVYCMYDHKLYALCQNILRIYYVKLQYLYGVPQMDDLSQWKNTTVGSNVVRSWEISAFWKSFVATWWQSTKDITRKMIEKRLHSGKQT